MSWNMKQKTSGLKQVLLSLKYVVENQKVLIHKESQEV